MATLLWQRDTISGDVDSVKTTFSSWDACMSKAYCKWPVIIVIIIGSLIVLSVVWCAARCLCCGVECCCGCLKCCNACCPSPRRRNRNEGYQQAPPTPFQNQYQPPPAPVYASGGNGYRGAVVPQTATFDAPSRSGEKWNEDSLPAMPSWTTATSRREEVDDDVELEKLDHNTGYQTAQQETLLSHQETGRYYGAGERTEPQDLPHNGDMGSMNADSYRDYHQPQQHQQFPTSPYGSQNPGSPSPYSPVYQPPASHGGSNAGYFDGQQYQQRPQQQYNGQQRAREPSIPSSYQQRPQQQYSGQQRGYEPSIPPSYHTHAPSEVVSPVSPQATSPQYPGQQTYQAFGGIGRKPVQGSWREV